MGNGEKWIKSCKQTQESIVQSARQGAQREVQFCKTVYLMRILPSESLSPADQ